MKLIVALVLIAVAVFAIDRLLLWFEWRGWIDYRRTKADRSVLVPVGRRGYRGCARSAAVAGSGSSAGAGFGPSPVLRRRLRPKRLCALSKTM